MLAAAPPLLRPFLLCLLLPIVPLSATLVNITVDDTDGDASGQSTPLSYSPHALWSEGQDCPGCNVHSGNTTGTVDVSQVFDGTWHDSTYHPGDLDHLVSTTFTGTAVYVYNIIVNQIPYTTTLTNLTFWINSDLVGTYVHIPENTTAFEYNVLVYSNTSLPNAQYVFTMSAGGPNASLILFDRLVYTQDDSSNPLTTSGSSVSTSSSTSAALLATSAPSTNSSKSATPIGAIVGGVVGGVFGLAIVGMLAWLLVRSQRQTARKPPPAAEKIDPFVFGGGAQRDQSRRTSRAPYLPDLRFGRSRLMPKGPGSAVTSTDASSSTDTQTADGFHGHRPQLPPMSPAETARSREAAAYASRIQALEAQVRALEVQQQLGPVAGAGAGSEASGSRTQLSLGSASASTPTRSRRSRSRGRSGRSGRSPNASASAANLRSELASLRSEIAALRGELSQDQLGVLEAAPSYVS